MTSSMTMSTFLQIISVSEMVRTKWFSIPCSVSRLNIFADIWLLTMPFPARVSFFSASKAVRSSRNSTSTWSSSHSYTDLALPECISSPLGMNVPPAGRYVMWILMGFHGGAGPLT